MYCSTNIQILNNVAFDALNNSIDQLLKTIKVPSKRFNLSHFYVDIISQSQDDNIQDQFLNDLLKIKAKVSVINQHNLFIVLFEGNVRYIAFFDRTNKLSLVQLVFYVFNYLKSNTFIDSQLEDAIDQCISKSYLYLKGHQQQQSISKEQIAPVQKDSMNTLNKYIEYELAKITPQLVEFNKEILQDFQDSNTTLFPVFSGISALLRIIYPDNYYAFQIHKKNNQQKAKQENNQTQNVIYLAYLDSNHQQVQTLKFGDIQIHLTRVFGNIDVSQQVQRDVTPSLYNILRQQMTPLQVFINYYEINHSFKEIEHITALYLAANSILVKKREHYIKSRFYSKVGRQLPSIQISLEQIKIQFIQLLRDKFIHDLE